MKREIGFTARLGRIILGLFFVVAGLFNIVQWQSNLQTLLTEGVPSASIFLAIAIAIQIIFGALMIFGTLQRTCAILQILLIILSAPFFLNFWTMTGQIEATTFADFITSIAIIGGLILVIATAKE